MNIMSLSPQQTKEALRVSLAADVVTLCVGAPALGKSSIIKQLAEEEELQLIDLRLTQLIPSDLIGLPKVNEVLINNVPHQQSTYIPMDVFPLENTPLSTNPKTGKPYKGFLLFLDELTSADKYVQASAYRILLDREVGNGEKLHPLCRIVAAGNRLSDNAVVNKLGSAIRSRMVHINVEMNIKEFISYVEEQVMKGLWHPYILAFLNFRPELANNFDPKKDTETFASPRTYEFLSNLLQNGLLYLGQEVYKAIINGTIGDSAGSEFSAFLQIMNGLPSIEQIVTNPMQAPMPIENGAKYALGAFLANKINDSNANAIITYLERIEEKDLLVLAYRIILSQYPNIMMNKTVLNSLGALRHKLSNTP